MKKKGKSQNNRFIATEKKKKKRAGKKTPFSPLMPSPLSLSQKVDLDTLEELSLAEKQVDELSKELAELKDERTLLSERKKVIKQRLLDTLEGGSDDGAEPGATYNQSRDSREIEEIEGRMEQNMFSTTKKTLLLRELQKALGIPVKVPEQKPSLQ